MMKAFEVAQRVVFLLNEIFEAKVREMFRQTFVQETTP
jgi:hypothetical protein